MCTMSSLVPKYKEEKCDGRASERDFKDTSLGLDTSERSSLSADQTAVGQWTTLGVLTKPEARTHQLQNWPNHDLFKEGLNTYNFFYIIHTLMTSYILFIPDCLRLYKCAPKSYMLVMLVTTPFLMYPRHLFHCIHYTLLSKGPYCSNSCFSSLVAYPYQLHTLITTVISSIWITI